jgi:hypothetical protein
MLTLAPPCLLRCVCCADPRLPPPSCRRRLLRVHPLRVCEPAREGRPLEPCHRWLRCGRHYRSEE